MCFRIKQIYKSIIKQDMFLIFTYGCETVFLHVFWGQLIVLFFSRVGRRARCKKTNFKYSFFVCDVRVYFEEKIEGIFAYSEVY